MPRGFPYAFSFEITFIYRFYRNANEEYDRSLTPTSPTPLPEQPEKEQDVQSPVAKSVAKEKVTNEKKNNDYARRFQKFDARPRNIGDYHETKPCRENLQLHLENPKRPSEQPSASEMNYSPDRQIAQPNVEEDLEENVDEEADDISDTQTTKPRQSVCLSDLFFEDQLFSYNK